MIHISAASAHFLSRADMRGQICFNHSKRDCPVINMQNEMLDKLLKKCDRKALLDIISMLGIYYFERESFIDYCKEIRKRKNARYVPEAVCAAKWGDAARMIAGDNRRGHVTLEYLIKTKRLLRETEEICVRLKLPWAFRKMIIDDAAELFPDSNLLYQSAMLTLSEALCLKRSEVLYLVSRMKNKLDKKGLLEKMIRFLESWIPEDGAETAGA